MIPFAELRVCAAPSARRWGRRDEEELVLARLKLGLAAKEKLLARVAETSRGSSAWLQSP